jgi:uncharacterized membrane protein YphA (DoxX/SURF4 family)
MRSVLWIGRAVIGALFIFSGWTKLFPIEFFELDLLRHHLGGEFSVLFISRILIGLEFACGLLLLLPLFDPWAVRLSVFMLMLYSFYLGIVLVYEGNLGNCGCFGYNIKLTPAQGLIKNFVMILALLPWWNRREIFQFRWKMAISIVAVLTTLSLPFILNRVIFPQITIVNGQALRHLNLEPLEEEKLLIPNTVLEEKQIVAFLLASCEHCRMAAMRLDLIHHQYPQLPITMVIIGESEDANKFRQETHTENWPLIRLTHLESAIQVAGSGFPSIMLLNNGNIEVQLDYLDINAKAILEWYQHPDFDLSASGS